ncbi:hypothetical protein RBH20_19695 [Haloarcula sp. H-GB4]|uniref:hypothetical protein n=1 Tax=Haloarcula sp. H-GB4 TaxID=3069755 RepID=UPI0027B0800B|nr:hypothetical protein [Haloarcula sp. H-GB4]MDQ2074754.1 hypothetical protein [Haloarcula sp. H-GB4]
MKHDDQSRTTRRNILRATGGSILGTATIDNIGRVSAQSANASVTLNSQDSSGDTIVLESLNTDIDARLYITPVSGEDDNLIHKSLYLSSGTSFTNRTIQLDRPIEDSTEVSAVIQAGEDYSEVIADDTALIAIGESLEAARASMIRGGEMEMIDADPDAGFHYPYVLFKPDTEQDTSRPLFVEPHNSRPIASREELTEQLSQRAESYLRPAITLSLPGLVPGFPRTPEDGGDYVQSLALEMLDSEEKRAEIATDAFPPETLHRVDQQLLNMIKDARERLGSEPYPIDEGIHMNGFSASGSFSTRFALLYPERVGSMSLGGGGARPLPLDSKDGTTLPYPLGTADYADWVNGSFDREAWTAIDQYIYLGKEDQPLPETDPRSYYPISVRYQDRAEAVYGRNRVTERLPVTRTVYNETGANTTFRVYEGVGHTITGEILRDITQFHRRTSNAQHALFELTLQRSANEVTVGTPVTVIVQLKNRLSANATAATTFSVDGTEIDTRERDVGPNNTAELTFDHTFDNPGSYTLTINGREVGSGPVSVIKSTPTEASTDASRETGSVPVSATESTPTEASTDASGPGFGVGTALAGVTGLSYFLLNEKTTN